MNPDNYDKISRIQSNLILGRHVGKLLAKHRELKVDSSQLEDSLELLCEWIDLNPIEDEWSPQE
jgi:hypothetical protein